MTAENNTVDKALAKLLDRLISVIGDEALLFEKFLELLEQQQKALIENDTDELKSVTTRLQQIVSQSQKLEAERVATIEEIRCQAGEESDLDVARICDMADSARSSRLHSFRNTMLDLYGRIEDTRMRNGLLIEQSMKQIQNSIDIIGRITTQKETDHKHGSFSGEFRRPGKADRRDSKADRCLAELPSRG